MSNDTIDSSELNQNELKPRKHLLILGAGASMSLVPEDWRDANGEPAKTESDRKYDANAQYRMPSGKELVDYIANYSRVILANLLSLKYYNLEPYWFLSQENREFYVKLRGLPKHSIIDPEKILIVLEKYDNLDYWEYHDDILFTELFTLILHNSSMYEQITGALTIKEIKLELEKDFYGIYHNYKMWCYVGGIDTGLRLLDKIGVDLSDDMLLTLLRLLYAVRLVKTHNPNSIDYFINGLNYYARSSTLDQDMENNFEQYVTNNMKPAGMPDAARIKIKDWLQKNCETRILRKKIINLDIIEQHLKFIVFQVISEKQLQTIQYYTSNLVDDKQYFDKLEAWLVREANKSKVEEKQYIEQNLNTISFNYDVIAEGLYDLGHWYKQPWSNSHQLQCDIHHVYGVLQKHEFWDDNFHGGNYYIKLSKIIKSDVEQLKNYSFDNHLELCCESINWIRYKDKDKEQKYKTLIQEADNIYFLGFGFDVNNLDNIGFTADNFIQAGFI